MENSKLAKVVASLITRCERLEQELAAHKEHAPTADSIALQASALIAKPRDGKNAEPVNYDKIIREAAALIPKPQNGRDGRDAPAINEQLVAEAVLGRIPKPKDGVDGKNAEPVNIPIIVKAVVGQLPNVQAQEVDEDEIVRRVRALIPTPKDGKDGKSVTNVRLSNNSLFVSIDGKEKKVGSLKQPRQQQQIGRQQVGGGGGHLRSQAKPVIDGQVRFVEVLRGQSEVDQNPVGQDNPLVLEFGPAQGGPSDPIVLESNGEITVNKTAQYSVRFSGQYGRVGSQGTSWLYFRTMIAFDGVNFIQVGRTVLAKFENANSDIPIENSTGIVFLQGWKVRVEVMRGSEGVDNGGLVATVPVEGTWNISPSTEVVINEIVWEQTQ